jgi:hypothetical protein
VQPIPIQVLFQQQRKQMPPQKRLRQLRSTPDCQLRAIWSAFRTDMAAPALVGLIAVDWSFTAIEERDSMSREPHPISTDKANACHSPIFSRVI